MFLDVSMEFIVKSYSYYQIRYQCGSNHKRGLIMKRVMVRYKVKADKAAENEEFIKRVFEELQKTNPNGLRYASFKLEDGVSFVHIASIETDNEENPLSQSSAFKSFQENIKDRCEEPPVAVDLTTIGSYRFLDK